MRFKDRWKRHSVAVPKLTRKYEAHKRNAEGKVVRVEVEELVHANDVYRQVVNGKVTKQLWHRGALVGSA